MKLFVEPSGAVPLVWYEVVARGGAASDAAGDEGLTRCAAELARRGAGERSRGALDRAFDELGASCHVTASRDRIAVRGVCLGRHLDATLELVADVLAAPAMTEAELVKLVIETRALLDETRDDDGALVERAFVQRWADDHPYGRTALGTESSLAALARRRDELAARYRALVVPANLCIGFAGDIDEARASALATRLCERLPDSAPPAPLALTPPPLPPRRRAILVDKPERTQVEIALGAPAPRVGTPDFEALTLVETAFGGTFTSRLMQELRVKHGWTYGASCHLGRARGPLWFRLSLASAAETAAAALTRTLEMYEELAERGLSGDELDFAHGYLAGHWPFSIATPQARLRLRMDAEIHELPADFVDRWPERVAAVTLADTRAAIQRWLRPTQTTTALVATAPELRAAIEATGVGELEVVPFDAI